jgi:enoyl-CoA hydratase/carnithine racemase
MSAELQALRRDATLVLTLSNPGKRNALEPDMCAAAIETLATAERDGSIRAVILTGAGDFFCAGNDLRQIHGARARNSNDQPEGLDQLHGWIDAIVNCPKPVIAAVEGMAADAGFSLAMACDLIVAGASSQFMMRHAQLGLTPLGGGSWFAATALPRQLATEFLMYGKPLDARRLFTLGVVNRTVADGMALDAAVALADELADLSLTATERIKSLLREAQTAGLAGQLQNEKQSFIESLRHRDAGEGLQAFFDKRKPNYS